MNYEEMGFVKVRGDSYGYRAMFDGYKPVGYGKDVDSGAFFDEIDEENAVNDAADDLYSGDTPLYRAADGQFYKVNIERGGAIKIWIRAALLPDRAQRFQEFRTGKGTLRELEEKTGIKAQNISKLENGGRDPAKASGETLLKLADALGVTMEELVR